MFLHSLHAWALNQHDSCYDPQIFPIHSPWSPYHPHPIPWYLSHSSWAIPDRSWRSAKSMESNCTHQPGPADIRYLACWWQGVVYQGNKETIFSSLDWIGGLIDNCSRQWDCLYDGSNIANPHSMFKRKPMGAGPGHEGRGSRNRVNNSGTFFFSQLANWLNLTKVGGTFSQNFG